MGHWGNTTVLKYAKPAQDVLEISGFRNLFGGLPFDVYQLICLSCEVYNPQRSN